MVYLLAFLDRANVRNARVAGLRADLALADTQYQTIQCLVHNYAGFLTCQFFLGMIEGGLFPGIILYLSSFYRRQELSPRIALFWSAASLSGAFSGLLAAAISRMDGVAGIVGWRWIFCLEGIFTVGWAIFIYFYLPNNHQGVKLLSAEEVSRCVERLRLDVDIQKNEEIKSVRSVLVAAYSAWPTSLHQLSAHMISDKYMMRGIPIIITYLIALAGSIMFLVGRKFGVRYTGLILLLGGVYSNAPIITACVPNNRATHTRRATSVAMTCISVNLGGIISTWILPGSDAPYYPLAAKLLLSMNVIAIAAAALAMVVCERMNEKKMNEDHRQKLLDDAEQVNLCYKTMWELSGLGLFSNVLSMGEKSGGVFMREAVLTIAGIATDALDTATIVIVGVLDTRRAMVLTLRPLALLSVLMLKLQVSLFLSLVVLMLLTFRRRCYAATRTLQQTNERAEAAGYHLAVGHSAVIKELEFGKDLVVMIEAPE
ncbi:hypothetical protein G7046_g9439 [Stylonectria norvegica]|nr:hypothetical protein G7046_g9439 [Stylonectria norvegica]